MTFMLTNDTESVIQTTTPASIHRIGSLPVYFPPSENSQSVYALSEELWRIRYLEKIEMEQVLLPKFNRPISSFAFFIRSELLAVIADDRLHVFKLGTLNGVNIQKMKLGETPKRVIYDASSNYFIAMSVAIKGGIRRNSIALIDPTT
ncbi:hypothetical protein BDB01DRAFT_420514 [Pilobolus umbonatus]|nr:hypothetical protein BDB01DRAFT_420514 [Pilobolus umbonatus]